MSLPDKPRYMEACNRCGICCALEVCSIGQLAYPGAAAPCPGLKLEPDGKATYCEVIRCEIEHGMPPLLQVAMGVGIGCTMRDGSDDEKRFRERAGRPA
jgi:hypothetical protein